MKFVYTIVLLPRARRRPPASLGQRSPATSQPARTGSSKSWAWTGPSQKPAGNPWSCRTIETPGLCISHSTGSLTAIVARTGDEHTRPK